MCRFSQHKKRKMAVVGEDVETPEHVSTDGGHAGRSGSPRKSRIKLPRGPAVSLTGEYPRASKARAQACIHTLWMCSDVDEPRVHYAKWRQSQEEDKYCVSSLICNTQRSQNHRDKVKRWCPGAGAGRDWGAVLGMGVGFVPRGEEGSGNGRTAAWVRLAHWAVRSKPVSMVNFMLRVFYHD